MRKFGGDKMASIGDLMQRMNMPDDMPIQAKLVSKSVESAQRKVEDMNFAARKHVLEYDDVMNKQRQVIYAERNLILDGKDISEHVEEVLEDTVSRRAVSFIPDNVDPAEWDVDGLVSWLEQLTGKEEVDAAALIASGEADESRDAVVAWVKDAYEQKAQALGPELTRVLERQVMLRVIDTRWMNYLQEMDYLKAGIGLRGYGQRDPLVEYKEEAYAAFGLLVDTMYEDFLRTVLRIELAQAPGTAPAAPQAPSMLAGARFSGPAEVDGDNRPRVRHVPATRRGAQVPAAPQAAEDKTKTYVAKDEDPYAGVGRNDKCPCGSGKKFKDCHGKNA